MPDTPPVDQHHRDRIRTDHQATLFVEAGAGTGKTTSLIERLVSLVGAGVPVTGIAAITFTEAAAAELRDRLREELDRHAADEPSNPAWNRALDDLDSAAIQTLHGFAQRILGLFPLEAGLPPGFAVRDEPSAQAAFDERWSQFLDEFLGEGGPAELVEVLEGFGCTGRLKDVASALHANWDRLSRPAGAPDSAPLPRIDEIVALLEEAITVEPSAPDPSDPFLVEIISRYKTRLPRLRVTDNHYDWCQALFEPLPYNKGNAKQWPAGVLAAAKGAINQARAIREEWLAGYGAYLNEHLLYHLSGFVLDYADERRSAGTLEFQDLLVLARDVLAGPGSTGVREALHQRFTRILIDEFQDTDPLQVELATRIARHPDTPPAQHWNEGGVPAGSLFVVGDPRQSIYRFRRADMALYGNARDALGADQVPLSQNFRSRPGIIDWVNHAFAPLLGHGDKPLIQPPYAPLASHRPATDAPQVLALGGPLEGKAAEWRRRQGTDLAAAITALRHNAEQWGLCTPDGSRPISLSDIAVLFRTRAGVASVEMALEEAGIPYRVESRSLLYQTQEIADLANILAALADPTDEVALVASLRSPAFACTDRELLDYARAGGRWDYSAAPPAEMDPDHPVVAGLAWLAAMHDRSRSLQLNEIVDAVISGRRMMELAYAFRRPREHWQRYRLVLDQARAFAAEPGASLRRFVAWLRRQQDENTRVLESAAPHSDDEAVRLMTVHSAKGLQFPVVFVTGLGTRSQTQAPPVVWDREGTPHVRLRKEPLLECASYEAAWSWEKDAGQAEETRILYVAATRAEELLVLGLHHTATDGKCDAARLLPYTSDEAIVQPFPLNGASTAPPEPAPSASSTGEASSLDITLEARDAWAAHREQRIAVVGYGNAIPATRVAKAAGQSVAIREEETAEALPWKRGRAGSQLGRAVHAALQVVDFESQDAVEAIARAQAIAEGIPGREHEVERLVRTALASEAVGEARRSRHWREIFVSTSIEGHLLEGFIDLLYERDGALVVVDYKTDALRTAADIDAAAERYRLQLAAYALALAEQLDQPIVECRFAFVNEHTAAERIVPDPVAAMDQVRETLRMWPSTPV